jgi:hypothetical protein
MRFLNSNFNASRVNVIRRHVPKPTPADVKADFQAWIMWRPGMALKMSLFQNEI